MDPISPVAKVTYPHYSVAIVEDEDNIRELYKIKFESSNFTVFPARNGTEGLEVVKKNKPNLVLLDIMMPGLNGLDVLTTLKKDTDPAVRAIPVVLLTNLAEDAGHQKGIDAGAASYVMKVNRTPEQLVQLVRAIITSSGTNQKEQTA